MDDEVTDPGTDPSDDVMSDRDLGVALEELRKSTDPIARAAALRLERHIDAVARDPLSRMLDLVSDPIRRENIEVLREVAALKAREIEERHAQNDAYRARTATLERIAESRAGQALAYVVIALLVGVLGKLGLDAHSMIAPPWVGGP